jgi:hypothetical protein
MRWTYRKFPATLAPNVLVNDLGDRFVNVSIREVDGHWKLTLSLLIDFKDIENFPYISDPDLLSQWLPFAVFAVEPRVDGEVSVRTPDGAIGKGIVTEWDEGTSVGFRIFANGSRSGEGDNIFTLRLNPNTEGTEIMVVQQIPNPHVAAMVALGWDACLMALHHLERGEQIDPLPPDVGAFEDFVAQLGQDQPFLQPIPGGTRVRFERQTLLQPLDKFWGVMTAGVPLKEGDFAPPTFTGSGESGRISILTPPTELEYLTADGGRVKWRFHEHFGSTRINLQIAVPRAVAAEDVAETWRNHLNAVVRRVVQSD